MENNEQRGKRPRISRKPGADRRHSRSFGNNRNFDRDKDNVGRGTRDRGFGSEEGDFNSHDREDRGQRRPYNRDNRGFGSQDRGYNRSDRDHRDQIRGFGSEQRDNNRGERDYNREDRGFGSQDRGYNRSDRDHRDQRRGFGSDRRDNNRGERSYNREDRDSERQDRGYNRSDRDRRDPRRGFGSDRRDNNHSERGYGNSQRRYSDRKPYGDRDRNRDGYERRNSRRQEFATGNSEGYEAQFKTGEDGLIRLNKYISNSGICSRREADELIKAGAVTVNGQVVTEMGHKVKPEDTVVYGGERLTSERKKYLLLNKPKGYITTLDDPQKRNTVLSLIEGACRERLYPVGRLDRNTTGVLLFTNDGELTKKLTHPSFGARKIYSAELDKPLSKADLEQLLSGVELEDGPSHADQVEYAMDGSDKKKVGVELHSGKNRIVRRMFEALGYEVVKLDRVSFAGLTKKALPRGAWRFLTDQEVAFLKMLPNRK